VDDVRRSLEIVYSLWDSVSFVFNSIHHKDRKIGRRADGSLLSSYKSLYETEVTEYDKLI
jgi:hypothetical protein